MMSTPADASSPGTDGRSLDRRAIDDLVRTYASHIDAQRFADVAALFTEDGTLRVYDRPRGEAHGRKEIESLAARLIDAFAETRHDVAETTITFVGDDEAAATTALYAWHRFRSERPDGILWGSYLDRFERRAERWSISQRTLVVARQQDFDFPWITPESEGQHP